MDATATGATSYRASVASSVSQRRLERAQRRSMLRSARPGGSGETVEAEYDGEHDDAGVPEGRGRLKFSSGEVYEGEFRQGKIHGHGRLRFTSGDQYTGQFKFGAMDGHGTYRLADGEVMVGCCQQDVPTGVGAMWSADRQKTWKLVDGQPVEEISREAAAAIAQQLDEEVPPPPA
jgi:hypothetical protein